jgi:hypothetical protein
VARASIGPRTLIAGETGGAPVGATGASGAIGATGATDAGGGGVGGAGAGLRSTGPHATTAATITTEM